MNLFKFDRMGCGHDCEGAGKEHAPDIDGVVRLIGEMRDAKQDVFVNAAVRRPAWTFLTAISPRGTSPTASSG